MVPPSPPPSLLASRYRMERRLAQGGMAEVWLATDESLSRPVAVKVLRPQLASDAVAAERFRREAIAVAGLNHPNIVAVYDAVEFDGRQAVVMQYVPGRSLREILDSEGRLSLAGTLQVGAAVASALDAAHAAGLIHRDVKPGNILLTPDGRVLLTDFGIAKASSGGDDLTSENVMMGTAKYLSPEQVRGHRLDGRADLYALGLVLYECLAGRVPFRGESDADTALARLQRDPTPLGRLRPTLPAGVVALVHRLLARDPAQRPTSGAQVCEAIERIRLGTEPAGGAGDPRPAGAIVTDPGLAGPAAPAGPSSATTTPERPRPNPGPSVTVPRRDPTPRSGALPRPRPQRGLQQRRGPGLAVVGGLLLAALVAGGSLWAALNREGGSSLPARTTRPEVALETTAVTVPTGGDVKIRRLSTFDPRGDQEENDDRLGLATDGDLATAWTTECYQNQYFGAKQGVGVVVELTGPATGTLDLRLTGAPWNVDVYASGDPGGDLASWGDPVARASDQTAEQASIAVTSPERYLLVMFRQAPRDTGCSKSNPFRLGVAEMSFAA